MYMRMILRIRPTKRMLHLARMSPAPSRRGRGAVSSRERRWRGAWQLERMEHLGPVLLQFNHYHHHHYYHYYHLQGTQVSSPASSLSLSRGGAWLGEAREARAALRRQTAHRALLSSAEGGASPHT